MILLGEMRDLETISTALTAAETGHLVFATLHTQDAASTVDRVIDVFPAGQQGQIRTQLAGHARGRRRADAASDRRRPGPRRRDRGPRAGRRRPEPHPPGEDRADLLDHADRRQEGHADDGAGPRRARPPRDHHARRSRLPARAAPSSCSACSVEQPAQSGSGRPAQGRGGLAMDLKKEIKLKDLLPKRGSKASTRRPPPPEDESRAEAAKRSGASRFPASRRQPGEQAEKQPSDASRRSRSAAPKAAPEPSRAATRSSSASRSARLSSPPRES